MLAFGGVGKIIPGMRLCTVHPTLENPNGVKHQTEHPIVASVDRNFILPRSALARQNFPFKEDKEISRLSQRTLNTIFTFMIIRFLGAVWMIFGLINRCLTFWGPKIFHYGF